MSLVEELPLYFYPLESDVISMETDNVFKDLFIANDTSSLYNIACSLVTLQSLYGVFPNVAGKGRCARQVFDLMVRMRRDIGAEFETTVPPQFDALLILDRTADLTTPVVTQLTYEGLVDEFYGIKHSKMVDSI